MEITQYKEQYKKKLRGIIDSYDIDQKYDEFLLRRLRKFEKIGIFGAGTLGTSFYRKLKSQGVVVSCYIDNDAQKNELVISDGVLCYRPENLPYSKEDMLVLICTRYYDDIYVQLRAAGFQNILIPMSKKTGFQQQLRELGKETVLKNLFCTIDCMSDVESCRILVRLIEERLKNENLYGQFQDIISSPQYFPTDIVSPDGQEVFVDCGAYNGDIISDFLEFENESFEKYIGFELSAHNYSGLVNRIEKDYPDLKNRFVAINKGVSDRCEKITYCDMGESTSIGSDKGVEGQLTTIDKELAGSRVTFIKMDIEGEELAALNGARESISRWMPTLAICIYHKPDDFWTIPRFVMENWPDYKLFIRHHTAVTDETVLYAVRDK